MQFLALEFLNALLQYRHLLTQALVLISKALQFLVLPFTVASTSSIQALLDAALCNKLLIQTNLIQTSDYPFITISRSSCVRP